MTKNRITSTIALATFGLAVLGAIALAAPGNAETAGASISSSPVSANPNASGTVANPVRVQPNDDLARRALQVAELRGSTVSGARTSNLKKEMDIISSFLANQQNSTH